MTLLRLLNLLFLGPKVTIPKNTLVPHELDFPPVGAELRKVIDALYGGRALRIKAVDAGSNGGEELELMALMNSYYDIDRFGLSFVSSPRHADILFVSGPVTRNLVRTLKNVYEAMPKPGLVVAIGDGACNGGIWNDSYAVVGAVEKVIPVDIKIAGNPPTPEDVLQAMLHALRPNVVGL